MGLLYKYNLYEEVIFFKINGLTPRISIIVNAGMN
jgi:hypothetical protein